MLQVPEKFRLLAFCTFARHIRQPVRLQRFACMTQRFPVRPARALLLLTLCFALSASSCIKMARHTDVLSASTPENSFSSSQTAPRININTASRAELEKLPGIGAGLAARIIAHREQFGAFRRAEHLIVVRGISERRFLAMREFVTVK